MGRIYPLGKEHTPLFTLSFHPQISRNNSKETIFGQDRNLKDKENRRRKQRQCNIGSKKAGQIGKCFLTGSKRVESYVSSRKSKRNSSLSTASSRQPQVYLDVRQNKRAGELILEGG